MTLTKVLARAKKLNLLRQNFMSREDLQKAIKDTLIKYKEIIFCADTPICTEYLNELRRLQAFD